jgi:hypothetical protein
MNESGTSYSETIHQPSERSQTLPEGAVVVSDDNIAFLSGMETCRGGNCGL